jgi:RecB family endonuclease NucS
MISADKRDEILRLLAEGRHSGEIAAKLGVPKQSVAAIKAHRTMGTYSSATGSNSSTTPAIREDVAEEAIEATFSLEADLQEALRKNIAQLEEGLRVVDDGKEHNVPSGRIDILATDARKRHVVIELKAGTADRDALGQILSYMGDLQAADGDISVRGILIAGDFTARAVAAATAVPSIELMKYTFKFSFHTVSSSKSRSQ